MPFDWGRALSYAGQQAPGVGASIDKSIMDEEERKRKARQDQMQKIAFLANMKKSESDLARSEFETEAAKRARERSEDEREQGIGILKDFQSRRSSMEPLPEGQEGPVRPMETRYESAMKTGLPLAAGMYKPAGTLMGTISEEEKGRQASEALGTKFEQQQNLLEQRLQSAEDIARQKGLSAQDIAMLKMAFQGDQKEKDRSLKKELKSGTNKKSAELKLEIKKQLEKVINHPAKYSGISPGQALSFLPTESRDFKKQFDKLKSMMTLENLDYLKGSMSDRDVEFIKSASSALDLGASPEALDRELNSLYSKFKNVKPVKSSGEITDNDPLGIR